jgi:hypothetical protein
MTDVSKWVGLLNDDYAIDLLTAPESLTSGIGDVPTDGYPLNRVRTGPQGLQLIAVPKDVLGVRVVGGDDLSNCGCDDDVAMTLMVIGLYESY